MNYNKIEDVFKLQDAAQGSNILVQTPHREVDEVNHGHGQHLEAAEFAIRRVVEKMDGRNKVKVLVVDDEGVMHGIVAKGWIRKKHKVVTTNVVDHANAPFRGEPVVDKRVVSSEYNGPTQRELTIENDENSRTYTIPKLGLRGRRENGALLRVPDLENEGGEVFKPLASVKKLARNAKRAEQTFGMRQAVVEQARENEPARVVRDATQITGGSAEQINTGEIHVRRQNPAELKVLDEAGKIVSDKLDRLRTTNDPDAYLVDQTLANRQPPPPPNAPNLSQRTGESPPSVSPLAKPVEGIPPPADPSTEEKMAEDEELLPPSVKPRSVIRSSFKDHKPSPPRPSDPDDPRLIG